MLNVKPDTYFQLRLMISTIGDSNRTVLQLMKRWKLQMPTNPLVHIWCTLLRLVRDGSRSER